MIYRITFGFAGKNQGWAETWACKNSSANPVDLLPLVGDAAQKRANFLGSPYRLVGLRIAKFYDDVNNRRARGSIFNKVNYAAVNPTAVGPAEPADVAVLVRGTLNVLDPALAEYAGRSNQHFLGAPPDGAVSDGGDVDTGKNLLGTGLGAYFSLLTANGFGWLAVTQTMNAQIGSFTQNPDGTVTITMQQDRTDGAPNYTQIPIRVRAVNRGQSPMNGALLGYWTGTKTFVTREIIGIPTPQVGGWLRTYRAVPQFVPMTGYLVENVVADHKRGRPFGSSRGRQKARARG